MDRALSLLISAGIAAFGVWIMGYTIASGSPLGWTLLRILAIMLGSISLYQTVVVCPLTPGLAMSVVSGRPEVAGTGPNRRD